MWTVLYGYLRPDPGLKLLLLADIEIFKGLSGYVAEDEIRSFFQAFGEITCIKIPPSRSCGLFNSSNGMQFCIV